MLVPDLDVEDEVTGARYAAFGFWNTWLMTSGLLQKKMPVSYG